MFNSAVQHVTFDNQPSPFDIRMSDITTNSIRIQVESFYVEERSEPRENYFFFAYRIRISNVGTETAQLMSREWVITDSDGNVERVQGPGVVGEQPVLLPGESFEYTSFCPLRTSVGSMHGFYTMRRVGDGEEFPAEIAPFTLAVPGVVN
jgi:ApaG protein